MLLQASHFGAPRRRSVRCLHSYRCVGCHRRLVAAALDTEVATASAPQEQQPQQRSLTLRTKEARKTLRFTEGRVGTNKVVLIDAVATGSEAWAAGARPGDRVVAMSDPVRDAVLWTLSPNDASLRFVRDAMRLRVSDDITLVLEPLENAEEAVAAQQEVVRQRALVALQSSGVGVVPADEDGALADAQSPPPWAGLPTVSQRRNKKRQERLDQAGARNDTTFFSVLIAGILATPAIILAVAYFNGWLRIGMM